MKKKTILAAIGLMIAGFTALSGCSTGTATVPGIVQVHTVEKEEQGKITLNSTETVEVIPDMAQIVFGITTEHENAGECQQKNTEKLNQLLAYLIDLGYEERSIRTSGFSLDPMYDWSGNERRLTGYSMRTQVTVTDIPLDTVGDLLTNGVANGANEIQAVSYFSSEYDKAYEEALAKAVELARGKAEALAAASGNTIGKVLSIEEYNDNQMGRYISSNIASRSMKEMAVGDMAAGIAMNVMPGELQVTANISVEFELLTAE